MGNVKIIIDPHGAYQPNQIIKADDLIESYCECGASKELSDWLWAITRADAVKFIAGAWDLIYEMV